jgi:hypothetical protein
VAFLQGEEGEITPQVLIQFERLSDQQRCDALPQVFAAGDHQTGINRAALPVLEQKTLGKIGKKSHDFIPLVYGQEKTLIVYALIEKTKKSRAVEIGKGLVPIFLAPGYMGHPLQLLKIPSKRLND